MSLMSQTKDRALKGRRHHRAKREESVSQQLVPAEVCPPGDILIEELEARGWTQKDLAEIMQRPVQTINEIVKGVKQITPETALQLAEVFETSPQFWLNLENNYRLHLAHKDRFNQQIGRRSQIYQLLPIPELIKRNWMAATKSTEELEQEVCRFLGIPSLDQHPKQIGINFRYTSSRQPEANAQIAWLKRVEHLAKQQPVAPYDRKQLTQAIPYLLHYSAKARDVDKVPAFLLKQGIRFVIVPHLPKTYIDGAAFYLDNKPNQPTIALTLRHNRIDSFWFTLMHELAHIVLGHEGIILDNIDEGDVNEDEQAANQQARDWLLEPVAFKKFVEHTKPYFAEAKIESFAKKQGRHPGIVLGRLHFEGVPYQHLRKLLVPVKNHLKDWIDIPIANQSDTKQKIQT